MNHLNEIKEQSQIIEDLTSREKPGRQRKKNLDKEIRLKIDDLSNSIFRDMIKHYDNVLSSPIEYIVTVLLTALSGTIGKRAYIQFGALEPIFFNVWSVLIGKSSTMKKSTTMNKVLRDLEDQNKKLIDDYEREKYEYENNNPDNAKPKPQREYLIYPDDITIETLLEKLSGQKRGIFRYNEFSQFLKQFNKGYAGDFKQFLTHIYDVPRQYECDRVTRKGSIIERPFTSIVGASTLEWFKAGLENADVSSGFLARFLFAIRNVNDKDFISLFDLDERNSTGQNTYYDTKAVFDRLYNDIPDDKRLFFDKDAERSMRPYETAIHLQAESFETTNDESSFLTRLATYCFKIAGIIALTNNHNRITKEDVQDAIVLCKYYEKNIRFLLNDQLKGNRFSQKEQEIYDYISKQENKICSRSKVMSYFRLEKRDADRYFETLYDKDLINIFSRPAKNNKEAIYYKVIN